MLVIIEDLIWSRFYVIYLAVVIMPLWFVLLSEACKIYKFKLFLDM